MPTETFETPRDLYLCITVAGQDDARIIRYRHARGGQQKWTIDRKWVTCHYRTFEEAREAARGLVAEDEGSA